MTANHHSLAVRAAEILGSPSEAEDWLQRRAPALKNQRPRDLLQTPNGQQLLHDYLTHLEQRDGLA